MHPYVHRTFLTSIIYIPSHSGTYNKIKLFQLMHRNALITAKIQIRIRGTLADGIIKLRSL